MNLLLVDDHPLFGLGFAQALAAARPGVAARWVPTLEQGLDAAAGWQALDVAVLDYRLDGADDGLQGLRDFGQRFPLVARVLITGEDPRLLAPRARAAGASACLGKHLDAPALLAALDTVLAGGERFDEPAAPWPAEAGALTARQLDVLLLVAQGRLNKQIADQLGIAERTVKLHMTALMQALGARNRTHLLARAQALGLL